MIVGVGSWQLMIPGCRSLKEKRMVVKSIKDRIRHRFNVSIAETAHQDSWSQAELTAAVVAANRGLADSMLDKVDRFIEGDGRTVISHTARELH